MAVLSMKKLQLVAMKKDRREILNHIQRWHVLQVTEAEFPEEIFISSGNPDTLKTLKEELAVVEEVLRFLQSYGVKPESLIDKLNGRYTKSAKEYDEYAKEYHEDVELSLHIIDLRARLTEYKSTITRCTTQREELVPWIDLEIPWDFKGTKYTRAFIGSINGEHTHENLMLRLAQEAPHIEAIEVEVISTSKPQTCMIVYSLKENGDELKQALDRMEFQLSPFQSHEIPSEMDIKLKEKLENAQLHVDEIEEELQDMTKDISRLKFLSDYLRIRVEKHEALFSIGESRHTFVLEGFVTEERAEKLEESLNKNFDCGVSITDPKEDEEVPVTLHNSRFSEPLESVVNSYGRPLSSGIDPTAVMSFFYYFMFGIMFSDAGYGLILASVCAFLILKFKNMDRSLNKSLRMFFWCGVSTMFWGVVFSSYFGDIVDVTSKTFFGRELTIPPLWFTPLDRPMLLLMFCLGIGVIHLTAGYIMNAATAIHNKDYSAAIYDALFPVMFIMGILVVFVSTDMFGDMAGFTVDVSESIKKISLSVAGLACLGVVLTSGRDSKSIPIRLLKGLYGVYNMLAGWISDILSYSRLLALGLATGVIGSVINALGAMVGGGKGILGFIPYIIILIFGHAINFGLNILGSYVHSNRLEYVEFFGKFYEGGGKEFKPLGVHTKYFSIREEKSNG